MRRAAQSCSGPSVRGLDVEDLVLARTILTVPINPKFASLNLAQAVILVAYEWSKHRDLAMPPARGAAAAPRRRKISTG